VSKRRIQRLGGSGGSKEEEDAPRVKKEERVSRIQPRSWWIWPINKSELEMRTSTAASFRPNSFTLFVVVTFVSSAMFLTYSLTHENIFFPCISQMILYVLQAFSSVRSVKAPQSQTTELSRMPRHFHIYICFGAMCAVVSAFVYPHHHILSAVFSFGASIGQAISVIEVSSVRLLVFSGLG
jgi:hypothetical protein